MYAQENNPNENKSRAIANSVAQKKSNAKQGLGFADNRAETIAQRKLIEITNNHQAKLLRVAPNISNDSLEAKHIAQLQAWTVPEKSDISLQ